MVCENITSQTDTRVSVKSHIQDLAITAVVCYIGGVGSILLVALIYSKVSHRKKQKESKTQTEEEEGSTKVISNHVSHRDVNERGRDIYLQANRSSHLMCPDCTTRQRTTGPNPVRWSNKMNREMEAEEERERGRMRMMTEDVRRKQGVGSRDVPNKLLSLGNSHTFSHPRREYFSERQDTVPVYNTARDMDNYRTDVDSQAGGHEILHCQGCHNTYKSPEQTTRPGRIHTNTKDSALFDTFPAQYRLIDRGNTVNQFDLMNNTDLRRESRNVTFNLKRSRTLEQENIQDEDKVRTSRDKDTQRKRKHKGKTQSGGTMKVKLNLSPLRKSKVHPKSKNKQSHVDKSSSKKSKEKKEDGKEKEEKEAKKTKGSDKKMMKSTKSTGTDENKEDEGEEKNKVKDNDEDKHLNTSQSTDITNSTATQPPGSVQYPATFLGNVRLSSQHPLSLSVAERSRTTNLSLQTSSGNRFSHPAGNMLLNAAHTGSNTLLPNGPASSVAPCLPIAALDSFNRQTGISLMPPNTSLLANTIHPNALQGNTTQQTGIGLIPPATSLLANMVHPNVLQGNTTQQTGEGLHQRPPENQTSQIKETVPVQAQAPLSIDGLPKETSQALASGTTVENVSNKNSQTGTETVSAGSTANVLAAGVALTEGAAVGVSGDSSHGANLSVSGVPSVTMHSESSTGGAAALLQQEYVSGEGGLSPRRKLKLVLPEKITSRPPTALERKIR